MNTKQLLLMLSFFGLLLMSCKKKDDVPEPANPPAATTRNVTYEITGNYSGHLLVVYNDNVSGNTTLTVTALPWRKDVSYAASIRGIGIGGNGSSGKLGVSGQSASLKIYVSGNVVKSSNASADANGGINLPALAHTF